MKSIIVVGCMRNGTSLVANTLRENEFVYAGEEYDLEPTSNDLIDPNGIGELINVVRLNNQLLQGFGGGFAGVRKVRKACRGDYREMFFRSPKIGRSIYAYLEDGAKRMGASHMLHKDPRTTITIDYWYNLSVAMGYATKVVWAIRKPESASRSIANRGYDGMFDVEDAWDVWHMYNQKMHAFQQQHPGDVLVTPHEWRLSDECKENEWLFSSLGLVYDGQATQVDRKLQRFRVEGESRSELYHTILAIAKNQRANFLPNTEYSP